MTLAVMAATALVSPRVFAQDAAGAFKVGVVDRKQVFDNYNKKKDEMAVIEGETERQNADFKAKGDALQKKIEAFNAKRDSLSEQERIAEEERLSSEMNTYKAEFKTTDDKYQLRARNIIVTLRKEIDAVIQEIAVNEGYHIVLEGDSDPESRSSVLYFATAIDMTQKVTEALNAKYGPAKNGGGSASAPAAESKPSKKK